MNTNCSQSSITLHFHLSVWGFISSCIVTRCLFFFFTWFLVLHIILCSLCIYCLFLCFSSKFGNCLVLGTTPIRSTDAADTSRAPWLADRVVAQCPINRAGCRRTWLIDSRKQPMSAADSGFMCTTPFVQCFTLSFANGRIFSDGPWRVTVGIRSVLDRRFGSSQFYWIGRI